MIKSTSDISQRLSTFFSSGNAINFHECWWHVASEGTDDDMEFQEVSALKKKGKQCQVRLCVKTTKLQKPATNARSKHVVNAPVKCERNYCEKKCDD